MNDHSRTHGRPRRIQGFRAALYMATLVAVRHDPIARARYQHLIGRGKPKKVAIVACKRTRLNYLTSLLSDRYTAPAAERIEAGSQGQRPRTPETENELDFQDSRSPMRARAKESGAQKLMQSKITRV